jgi:hypothetical protein
VPEARSAPFWHFCHPVILGYLENTHALLSPTRSVRRSFFIFPQCVKWGILYVNKLRTFSPGTSIIYV